MVPPFVVVSPFPPWGVGRTKSCAVGRFWSRLRERDAPCPHVARRTMRRREGSEESPMNKPERLTSAVAAAEFQVGSVIMRRPFRFRISDPLDFGPRLPEDKRASVGTTVGYFSRHGTDHHSFVFFPGTP